MQSMRVFASVAVGQTSTVAPQSDPKLVAVQYVPELCRTVPDG